MAYVLYQRFYKLKNVMYFRLPVNPTQFLNFFYLRLWTQYHSFMDEIYCGITAFRFYRTPPAVLMLFDALPIARDQASRQTLIKQPLVQKVLGTPLHVLVNSQSKRASAKNIKRHLWTGELPPSSINEIEGANTFTSPEMTLLLMARTYSVPRLALAMYEFCGSFAVFDSTLELDALVGQQGTERFNRAAGWHRVIDSKGRPTSLWNRPPLTTLDRLHEFAAEARPHYGSRIFARALRMVAGLTRSPLEAEAALLLFAPRSFGGYGFNLETNRSIPLSRDARTLYRWEHCEADIYLESPDGSSIVDIECQGAAVHTGETATISDANRTTALESMGINVVQITYADVRSAERLELIAEHVAAKLGYEYPKRTARMLSAERNLRRELPINWADLV